MNNITGRTKEKNHLFRAFDQAKDERGQIILVAGEAGVGKTALAEETLARSGLRYYTARCSKISSVPYGPVITILRNCLSESKKKTIDCGGLTKYLPLVLPELGEQKFEADAETLKEAIISALLSLAEKPTAFFIDDIQWIDESTLELLISLSDKVNSKSVVVVCTYSSDEITKDHPVKKLRNELRRRRKLNELSIEPLSFDETERLINSILNAEADEELVRKIYDRTKGIPLFIEEIVNSLVEEFLLKVTLEKVYLADNAEISIPENLKDTVLHQLKNLSAAAINKLEAASVAGFEFEPALIVKLTGNEEGFDELFDRKFLTELNPDMFSFRHFIIYEVVNDQVGWSRKKALHRQIAEYLERKNGYPDSIAGHWLAAGIKEKARRQYLISAEHSCTIHAYGDAARSAFKSLKTWTDRSYDDLRIKTLHLYAHCSQLTGNLIEAEKSLNEIIQNSELIDNTLLGNSYRQIANVYALQGNIELSIAYRLKAADIFEQSENLIESASELLIAAGKYTALLKLDLAYQTAIKSAEQADRIYRKDIGTQARALAGNILAMQGKFEEGKNIVQEALSDAISNDLSDAASIIYRRLASTMEFASDYSSAREAYYSAYNFCLNEGKEVSAQICLGCMSYTLFQTGEWKRSIEICDDLIQNKNTPEGSLLIGYGMKGIISALRGETKKAIRNLNTCIELSNKQQILYGYMYGLWGMTIISDFENDVSKAAQHYKSLIELWKRTQDRHDIILFLIWGVFFFSRNNLMSELNLCTEMLSEISSITGNQEALAGFAYAIGENALQKGENDKALEQFNYSLELVKKMQMPFLQMIIQFRLGVLYLLTDDFINAKKSFFSAQSISKNLGTRPFSVWIDEQLIQAGISTVESRKGDSIARIHNASLTRRQLEILELIVHGLTNKEIADKLFLSTRTVDMHVSHILERLNCRTRIEAINKARELEII